MRANAPPMGWPECAAIFPMGLPDDFLSDPIFHSGNLRCPSRTMDGVQVRIWTHFHEPCVRWERSVRNAMSFECWGPISRWSAPLLEEHSRSRPVRSDQHNWRIGGRSATDADGSWAQRATSSIPTPPAAQEAVAREVMEFSRAKGRAGNPPSITTGAQLGYSLMAYHSTEILFGFCDGHGSISGSPAGP